MPEERRYVVRASFAGHTTVRADLEALPDSAFWQAGEALPGARGRVPPRVLQLGSLRAVARDFRRGGALRALLGGCYLSRGRAARELHALAELHRRGVPVVVPLAALARRHRVLFHRLRLCTELVDAALPLPAFVAAAPRLRRAATREAGRVVACAFAAGLHHPDLHPDNLIARDTGHGVEVRLLDLDRASLRASVTGAARDRMLVRMARYLHRHCDRLAVSVWTTDHLRFLSGMGLDRSQRRRALQRLAPALRRELRLRGLRRAP